MKKQLLKSSTFRFIEIGVATILSILLTPYLIHNLGAESYGLWILLLSTLGWFNFIDLGFSYAVQRNITIFLEKQDNHKINQIFSVSVVLFSILGLLATVGMLTLAYSPSLLGIEENKQHTATIALSMLALKVLFDFMMNSFHGFYAAYLRMDIDAKISTLNTIIKSIAIYYLILELDIYGAVIATVLADIVTHSLKIYFAKKLHPEFKFQLNLVKFVEVQKLFAFSKHLVLNGIAKSANQRVDPIIISHLLGLQTLALFSVINGLIVKVGAFVSSAVGVFQMPLTKLVARGAPIEDVFKQILTINFFIVLIFYTPLAILAEDFIYLWLGPDFIQAAELASILGFAFVCKTISRPISSLLLAQSNHKLLSVVNMFGTTVNIILSISLGSLYGLKGIAISTAISFFVTDVVLHLYLLQKYTEFLILNTFLRFILTSCFYIIFVLIGKYTMAQFNYLSWSELFLASALTFIIISLISSYTILQKPLRDKIINMIIKRT
ncbi:polysaccharide biosynthesis C-terminal domain-containing protein [Thalassotalea piscium]|uniref:O-antigen/teichoic acid export membrane protein n=1 Tax=Thalassotalea piscium TaxID=1230533 RepID=A0A7X0TSA1_9GAMM|nr:polysaccharide biosynthesis C-terminal domain-containing protein [Thalassotalea piscium]MBB6541922.1 O-antigen/teichoic acid export membrane protein [Thalassotalea piscium]